MRFSTGTKTSVNESGDVFEARIPCFSSPFPCTKPSVPFSTTKKEGPSGVFARRVIKSAYPPVDINCLVPLILYPVISPELFDTGSAFVLSAARLLPAPGSVTA